MASGTSITPPGGGLAARYAAALYATADEARALDQTVGEMEQLGRLIDESAPLRALLASPLLDPAQAGHAIREVLREQGFSDVILRFAGVIAANRRLRDLRGIVAAFAALVASRRGVQSATVRTAHPLTDTQRADLHARLIESGHGQVNLTEEVDPALLGGLVLRIGARLYDSSIRSRLQRLSHAMKGAA
jgi:F-type H+-transporting ATPase subunit delta